MFSSWKCYCNMCRLYISGTHTTSPRFGHTLASHFCVHKSNPNSGDAYAVVGFPAIHTMHLRSAWCSISPIKVCWLKHKGLKYGTQLRMDQTCLLVQILGSLWQVQCSSKWCPRFRAKTSWYLRNNAKCFQSLTHWYASLCPSHLPLL